MLRPLSRISFVFRKFFPSAVIRIFGSVPLARIRHQPSSSDILIPSVGFTAPRAITVSRAVSQVKDSLRIGYEGIVSISFATSNSDDISQNRAAAYGPSGQYEICGKIQ